MHLLAQVADRLRTRAPYIALVFCHPALKVARPLWRQDKEREEVGNVGGEHFFADVGLATACRRFFRTSVVNIAVGIAVLLVFGAHFGGYRHPAFATAYKAAQRLWLDFWSLGVAALDHDFLHLVEQAFVYDGRMPPLVQFAAVEKVAVVKRIGENEADSVIVYSIAKQATHAAVVQKLPDVFEPRIAPRVQLERGADHCRLLAVEHDALGARVVAISRRSRTRKIAAPRFRA